MNIIIHTHTRNKKKFCDKNFFSDLEICKKGPGFNRFFGKKNKKNVGPGPGRVLGRATVLFYSYEINSSFFHKGRNIKHNN